MIPALNVRVALGHAVWRELDGMSDEVPAGAAYAWIDVLRLGSAYGVTLSSHEPYMTADGLEFTWASAVDDTVLRPGTTLGVALLERDGMLFALPLAELDTVPERLSAVTEWQQQLTVTVWQFARQSGVRYIAVADAS